MLFSDARKSDVVSTGTATKVGRVVVGGRLRVAHLRRAQPMAGRPGGSTVTTTA